MTVRHRLAAIWFADIVDYSRLSATDQRGAMRLVDVFEAAVGDSVRRYGGRVVKFLGDGVLAEFPSVQGAIAAADALQRAFGERAATAGFAAAALRVGIHSGEIVERGDGDVHGDGVNVAQRIQQAAGPGEIVVSGDAWRQSRQHAEIEFEPLGERDLKGVGRMALYRVVRLASAIEPEAREPETPGGWETFVDELKRRHVFRVAAIYAVVAWLAVQVANATFGPLGVPAWVLTLVVVVALVGAPVVVALAWAFDWTAGGVRRTDPGALPPSRARRLGRQLVATVAVLAAVPVGWVVFRAGTNGGVAGGTAGVSAAALDPARLAILYFDDRSPESDLEHLAAGFTESIIDRLSGVEGLEVLSRHAVEPFRGASPPPDSLARALGAGTLVNGSVERAGDRLRVRVQLIDATDLSEIASWSEERPMEEILRLQDDLADDVTSALRRRLGERFRLRERREGTRSVEAWEHVRRAEALAFQARKSQDPEVEVSLRAQADSLLARAESLDPAWVEPILVRAELAALSANPAGYARGLEHAERALRMDPGSATGLRLRGVLHARLASAASDSLTAARELSLAERDLRAAVAADPSSAPAGISLAELLYNDMWELAKARDAAREAHDNDAFLLEVDHFVWLCEISLQLGDYAEARRWCAEGLRRYPNRVRLLLVDLYVLAAPGVETDPAAAWRRVEQIAREEFPEYNVPPAQMLTAAVLARAEMPDSARAVVADARTRVPAEWAPYLDYFEAYVRLVLGERDRAVELLGSFSAAEPGYRALVARDVWFEELSGDPRFERIVDRKRLPIFCRILCEPPAAP